MKSKKTFLLLFVVTIAGAVYADPLETGKTIFTTRCAACHNINLVILGPALAGVAQRHSIDWIINFVHSSQAMVKKGDKDAVALFQKFNKVPMPDHPDLKEEDIRGIVAYISSQSKLTETVAAPFAKPGKKRDNSKPLGSQDYVFFIVYLGAVAALVRALVYLVQIKSYIRERAETPVIIVDNKKEVAANHPPVLQNEEPVMQYLQNSMP